MISGFRVCNVGLGNRDAYRSADAVEGDEGRVELSKRRISPSAPMPEYERGKTGVYIWRLKSFPLPLSRKSFSPTFNHCANEKVCGNLTLEYSNLVPEKGLNTP